MRNVNTNKERKDILRSFPTLRGSITTTVTTVARRESNNNRKAEGEADKARRERVGRGFNERGATADGSTVTTRK